VADAGNDLIRIINETGSVSTFSIPGERVNVTDVALDSVGNIYISDFEQSKIFKLELNNNRYERSTLFSITQPIKLHITKNNTLYVTCQDHSIHAAQLQKLSIDFIANP
jgi:hypothetical protein